MRLMGCSAMRARTVREIERRIEPVELGGSDQGVERSGSLAAGIGSEEQIILPVMQIFT